MDTRGRGDGSRNSNSSLVLLAPKSVLSLSLSNSVCRFTSCTALYWYCIPTVWWGLPSLCWAPRLPLLIPDYQPYLQLLDNYFEAYQHTLDPEERFALAQVMTDIVHRRPRFDLSHPYFVKAYREECTCLRLHLQLVRGILTQQVSVVGF